MLKHSDVIVIGAGLAGLGAVLELQKRGVDVLLLEASDRAGGRVATDKVDGFLCDRGFQLINLKYPALVDLDVVQELDFALAPRVIEVAIGSFRHAIGDPRTAPFAALNSSTGSIPEKIALLRLLFTQPKPNQSIGEHLSRVGSTYKRVLEPFLRGVFLSDPREVDASYGISIIRSFINGSPGVPKNGVGALPAALCARVKNLELNIQVESIQGEILKTSAGEMRAKKIIVATDSHSATQLLQLNSTAKMAGCITWYHSADVNPSGTGRLVVDGQKRGAIINSVVISDFAPSYAPSGQSLISTTTGLGVTELEIRKHASLIWGTATSGWSLVARYEIPWALPVQYVGAPLLQPQKISERVFIAGDHRSVPSQQGALTSGKLAAELAFN